MMLIHLSGVVGQFGRVLYAELECARGTLRQPVAVKTMKCAYMHRHFIF